jgi:hypothetical protein
MGWDEGFSNFPNCFGGGGLKLYERSPISETEDKGMMDNLYTMARVGGGDGVHGFGRGRRMTFADQIAVDAELAADDLVAQGAPDARMERVLELKAAIEAGRYFVPSEDLAERIMSSMLSEGRRKVH